MRRKNKADRKKIPQEELTAEETSIDQMLREDMSITGKIKALLGRMKAATAVLRQEMREKTAAHEAELNALEKRRAEIRNFILEYWEKCRKDVVTLEFPSAMVSRRDYLELVVHDSVAVLNALDRIGRLDLVEYVFSDKEVAHLYADGELKGIDKNVLEVIDHFNLQVRPGKKHG